MGIKTTSPLCGKDPSSSVTVVHVLRAISKVNGIAYSKPMILYVIAASSYPVSEYTALNFKGQSSTPYNV